MEQICLLLQPNMVSLRLGQGGNILTRPQAVTEKCYSLPSTEFTLNTFSLLNLCPTSQITPNVICLGLMVFSQVACCIMHWTVKRASHEEYGVDFLYPLYMPAVYFLHQLLHVFKMLCCCGL